MEGITMAGVETLILIVFAIFAVVYVLQAINIIRPYQKGLVERLGKFDRTAPSGLAVIFPPLRPLDIETTAQIEILMTQRSHARAAKDWPKSDELRAKLTALGVEVKDGPTSSTWRPRLAPPMIPG